MKFKGEVNNKFSESNKYSVKYEKIKLKPG
jgi:hypothetical protein